jgi:tripartite-type tricarboxylate transporter receptor subunit TctC
MILRRYAVVAVLAAGALGATPGPLGTLALAQQKPANFPERPIELVVAYPAGGGMDVTARTLAQELERSTGHQFRVQNRVGGGGIVGHSYLAKQAASDGYTVGVVASPFVFLDFLTREGQFAAADFEPVAGINFTPVIWLVKSDSPLGKLDFRGIVDEAKKNPKKIKVGVIPNNTFEFVTEFVEKANGVQFTKVPFQGGKPSVTALLGGNIDITNAFYEEVDQYIKSGELKPVAVSDTKRFARLPDTPAMSELGVRLTGDTWGAARFVTVPKGVPQPVKLYLAEITLKTLKDPKTVEAFAKQGVDLQPLDEKAAKASYEAAYQALHDFAKETGRLKK